MKQRLLASAALAICTITPAFSGHPYIGLGMGFQSLNGSININNAVSSTNFSLSSNGANGSIFGGYTLALDQAQHYWLAFEANGEPSVNEASFTFLGTKVTAQTYGGLGVSIKPTIAFNPHAKVFLTAGYQVNDFDASNIGSSWIDGVRYGIGTEINAGWNEQLALRIEALQTRYRSYSPGPQALGINMRPVIDQVDVGLVLALGTD